MSPEQARGEGNLVDRRCDIYSIGVILFQMLAGELPFRGTTRMLLHQLLYEEPKSPRSFNDRMPRDLETICLNCLQKEPEKRYQTAADLRDDLERYLKHEPILARPIGRMERAWRWCRRSRLVAGLTAAIAVSIIVGVSLSTYFAIEARSRARQAQEVTTIAVSTLETMIKDVQHSLRAIPEAREIRRELLRKSLADLERVSGEMQSQRRADRNTARALVDLGELFREAGDDAGLNADRIAETNLVTAVDIYRQLYADNPTDRQLRQEYSIALNALGNFYLSDHRLPAAKEPLFAALELARTSMNDGTNDAAYAVTFSWVLTNCGDWHAMQGRFREALPYFLDAEELVEQLTAADPENRGYRERLGECILKVGDVHHDLHENEQALEQFNRVLAISEEQYRQSPESSLTLDAMSFIYERLGNHWLQVGDPEQARGMYEKMLEFIELAIVRDPKNRDLQEGLAVGYGKIATVSMKLGNRQAAEAARRKAAEIRRGLAKTSN
jgi:tetratricopeptide (TPR) repeat protein